MSLTLRRELLVLDACSGILAAALVVLVILWQFGNVSGSRFLSRTPRLAPGPAARERAASEAGRAAPATPGSAASSRCPAVALLSEPAAVEELRRRRLDVPVDGTRREILRQSFAEGRDGRMHEAIDIEAPRNTPVVAVDDGTIAKLFNSRLGGITVYQFDTARRYVYYYAHLARYAENLREGSAIKRNQVIGYVGTSGNAPENAPHLHFAIFKLTEDKRWWQGTPIDPYDVLK
jgi:murein DD-endopeptidase MepM/ murein hydrolase activator NlpD